jgi:hypothetical protein
MYCIVCWEKQQQALRKGGVGERKSQRERKAPPRPFVSYESFAPVRRRGAPITPLRRRRGDPILPVVGHMTRFNPANIPNIDPNSTIRKLKWIGPYLAGRFRDQGYRRLQDVLDRISRHTQASNRSWLQNLMQNERPLQCIPSERGIFFGRPRNGYRIRSVNYFGYNAIITYARYRLPRHRWRHIPAFLQPDAPASAFPNRCYQ